MRMTKRCHCRKNYCSESFVEFPIVEHKATYPEHFKKNWRGFLPSKRIPHETHDIYTRGINACDINNWNETKLDFVFQRKKLHELNKKRDYHTSSVLMKTYQVIHIFALKSRGNKTSDINFNDILSKNSNRVSCFTNDKRDLPERKIPYKGELQNNMRDVVLVVSTLVSFLCWKKCFLGELRLNCALFFGFF